MRVGSMIFAKPISVNSPPAQQQNQNYRGFVQPLDASSVLLRICLPAGEGHMTLNASSARTLTFFKIKIAGKLERGGRLGGVGGSTSKLTEEKLKAGVFFVAGTTLKLSENEPMSATLEKLRPFIQSAASSAPKTATLELKCDGLSAPVLIAGYDAAAAKAIAANPKKALAAAEVAAAAAAAPTGPPAALEHATSSRPKVRRNKRGGGSSSKSGTAAGLKHFTLNPNKPTSVPEEDDSSSERGEDDG